VKQQKKIIVQGLTSQLGNQLVLMSNFIAFAKSKGWSMHYYGFGKYAEHFEFTSRGPVVSYPPRPGDPLRPISTGKIRRLELLLKYPIVPRFFYTSNVVYKRRGLLSPRKIVHLSLGALDACNLDDASEPLLQPAMGASTVIFTGWKYRAADSFDVYAAELRELFTPKESYMRNVKALLQNARQGCDMLVGLHVRGTDYKTHLGGRFYYDHEVYRRKMQEVIALFPGKKVRFLLCSDEPKTISSFEGFDVVQSTGIVIEDLYLLAGCQRIIGPPSTYSAWASFYGLVPVYPIVDPQKAIGLNDFFVYSQKDFVAFNEIYKENFKIKH